MIPLDLKPEKLYVQEGSPISFFTSPFHAHTRFGAIDIGSPPDGEPLFKSPVTGTVSHIEKFLINRPTDHNVSPYDYLLCIQTRRFLVKILHVKPVVSCDDSVKVGDLLGSYVRSPYLAPYHFSHAHIEMHAKKSKLNPSAAKPLTIYPRFSSPINEGIEGKIIHISKDYTLLEASDYSASDKITGILARVDDEPVVLNAELPGLCYGGLLGERIRLGPVTLCGVTLGKCTRRRGGMGLFERRSGALRNWLQFDHEILMNRGLPCGGLRIESERSYYKVLEMTLRVGAPPFLKLVGASRGERKPHRLGDHVAVRLLPSGA